MHNDLAIKVSNVSKYYKLYNSPKERLKEALSLSGKEYHKKFYALNHIDFEIKKGEIVGIVGRNGSGKSTLLKLITGVLTPSSGKIECHGEISALLELGSGFNPQFTGIENIYFYGSILGFTKKEMDEKLDDIISFADIGEFIYQPIKTYSSGMKSRLGFSVAVHIEPEILILDEVLSVGDVLFRRKAYAKMQEFFESGITIIYVSHNTNEINRLCTRALFLSDGEIIMDDEPMKVTKYYEKYIFAEEKNKKRIKEEIKKKRNTQLENVTTAKHSSNDSKTSKEKNTLKPYFIPEFVSKNRVEYDNTHLDIYDICIKTMEGDIVNVLVQGERYRYCYKLKFKNEFYDVGYGMEIHTEKGISIMSCAARDCPKEKIILHAREQDTYSIEWKFECLLNRGIYYTNAGVAINNNGEIKFINRITDALVFKVLNQKKCCGGLILLNSTGPSINKTSQL